MPGVAARSARCLVAALGLAAALPASALYKIVQPDGSVVYTDRPPSDATGRITHLGRSAAAAPAPETALPLVLRQAVQRHPVVLYTSSDCAPCASGRQLLQQRGVPYRERIVASDDDAAALERAVGGRTVPTLTIGTQPLRGYSDVEWTAFLDAAGYPKTSQLPPSWTQPPARPIVERQPVEPAEAGVDPAARRGGAAPAEAVPAAPPSPPRPGTLRF